MKKISTLILSILVISFIIPSIALAAWWNPFTWNWNSFLNIFSSFNKPVKTEVVQVVTTTNNQVSTTTITEEIDTNLGETNINNGLKKFTYTDNAFSFSYPSKFYATTTVDGVVRISLLQKQTETLFLVYPNINTNLISNLEKESIKIEFNQNTKNGYKYSVIQSTTYLSGSYLIPLEDTDNPTMFITASIYPNTSGFSHEDLDIIVNSLIIDKAKTIRITQESLIIARKKAEDAAVKASLANMRAQGELYYDSHQQTYATGPFSLNNGLCADEKDGFKRMLTALTFIDLKCYASSTAWVVFGPLKNSPDIIMCTDSTMYLGTTTSKNISVTGRCK